MPRPGPRRQNVAVRMSDEQIAALDEIAVEWGVKRSEVVRQFVESGIEDADASRRGRELFEAELAGPQCDRCPHPAHAGRCRFGVAAKGVAVIGRCACLPYAGHPDYDVSWRP